MGPKRACLFQCGAQRGGSPRLAGYESDALVIHRNRYPQRVAKNIRPLRGQPRLTDSSTVNHCNSWNCSVGYLE